MKTWFITGTSTGIGRILTEKLLIRGALVRVQPQEQGEKPLSIR